MLIDWFTVAAQIVNFVVLVALMKRFLYGPLVRAIDAREQRIESQMAQADEKNRAAEHKTQQVQKEIAELDSGRAQLIAEARSEAERQRNELIQKARDSVRTLEERWRADLRLEKESFFHEIRQAAGTQILATTRRVLADLAGADIERCAIQMFLERLRTFDAGALKTISTGGLLVASAMEIPAPVQHQIEQTIEARVGGPVTLRFELAPEVAWGVELRGNGQRIGWTPDGYLDSLEEKLRDTLEQRAELGRPVAVHG